jgi:hypothetical protein
VIARAVIIILAVGASLLNAWYFGSEIVQARVTVEYARSPKAAPRSFWSSTLALAESVERQAWRSGISVEIVVVTIAALGVVLTARRHRSKPPT